MKKSSWHKHHKWAGLILAVFIVLFALTGIVLNHPRLFATVGISRSLLPDDYRYSHWNKGLVRGTVSWQQGIIAYGNSGLWLTDSVQSRWSDFNRGLPEGPDFRNIRGAIVTPDGRLYALGQYGLYRYRGDGWTAIPLPEGDSRLSDITCVARGNGCDVVVTGRSFIYVSHDSKDHFSRLQLKAGAGSDGRVSLFRTVWLLHSGALFGIVGRTIADLVAIVLIVLAVTGVTLSFSSRQSVRLRRIFRTVHDKAGAWTIVFTLAIAATGWLLRPPGLAAIASLRVPPVPLSAMDSDNPWNDRLRSLHRDSTCGDWLLSTSEGFYSLRSLSSEPQPVAAPPVSVMGINAEASLGNGRWLIGSFSGLYLWDRVSGEITDCYTGQPPVAATGMPISGHAIAGLSTDIKSNGEPMVFDYYQGAPSMPMPEQMAVLPMSLRNVALEIHTGRIFTFLGMGTMLYIAVIGLAIAWCLWSGWKIRMRRRRAN